MEPEKYSNFSFRLTTDVDNLPIIEQCLERYTTWLKYRGYELVFSTAGIHRNSTRPHIHYHCVCKPHKPMTNPAQTIRADFEKKDGNSALQLLDYKNKLVRQDHTLIYGNKKLAMTQKHDQVTYKDYLQYPLKEGHPIEMFCKLGESLTLESLIITAKLVYIESKKIKEAKKQTETKEKDAYHKFVQSMHDQKFGNVREACAKALEIYREAEKPTHPDVVMRRAITYCYRCKILSIDQILESNYLTRNSY